MADALYSKIWAHQIPSSVGSATNDAISASDAGTGFIFQANSTDAITHIGRRYGARTGTPPTYIASLQGVTAGGLPDGSILGGGSPASVTFTPPADTSINGTWVWYTLANSYTPTLGQMLAMCWEYSSGTIDGSNNSSFTRSLGSMQNGAATNGNPYSCTKTGGTWAKTGVTTFGYRTANGRYGFIGTGAYATNIATSGQRSAMFFTIPSTWCTTYKVAGVQCAHRNGAAAGTYKLAIWDSAGSVVQTALTIDTDTFVANSSDQCSEFNFDSSPATLTAGTEYYIGFESVSSSSIGMRGIQLAEAADRSAFPNGVNRGFASWNGSAWTKDSTVMPVCSLILSDISFTGGGSGGVLLGGGLVL